MSADGTILVPKVDPTSVDSASVGDSRIFIGTDGNLRTKDESGTIVVYAAGAGDHGTLSGLNDDDHSQYHNDARGDARYYTQTANDTLLDAKLDKTDDLLFVENLVNVKKNPGTGEFPTIKDAIDSITTSSETNRYVIQVGPGIYDEVNPLVIPTYVSVVGSSINTTTVRPTDDAEHLFEMSNYSEISFLNLEGGAGSIGSGKAAINCIDVGDFAQLHKLSIYGFDIGLKNKSVAAESILYVEYVDINGDYLTASHTEATNSFFCKTQLENFYTYESTTTGSTAVLCHGVNSQVKLGTSGLDGSDNGVKFYNAADVLVTDVFIRNMGIAVYNENTGSASTIRTLATSIYNCTEDYKLLHPTTTGSVFGGSDATKNTIDSGNVSALFIDPTNDQIVMNGHLQYSQGPYSQITEISQLWVNTPPMGVIDGGVLSAGSGLTLNIASGYGYQMNGTPPNDIVIKREWSASTLTLSASTTAYVYINDAGNFTSNVTEPDSEENILFGKVTTDASNIIYIEKTPLFAHHIGNFLSKTMRHAFGPLFVEGCAVTESGTRNVDVTMGHYHFAELRFAPSGGTAVSFDTYYQHATPGQWVRTAAQTTVSNTLYDDGSGTLATIPSGKFVKHLLIVMGGPSEKYILVYGQEVFDTQQEAIDGGVPTKPDFMGAYSSFANVASIVTGPAQAAFYSILDERPRSGFSAASVSGGGGGVSDHGALTGLADDDHTQYILANGTRAFTGSQSFGGNNITSVGTVNGVTVETHASRHLPNGADPLTTGTPSDIGATNSEGTANALARQDHVHAHGSQAGGTTHDVATTSVAGFMSSADKTKLDGIVNEIRYKNTSLLTTTSNTVFTNITEMGFPVVAGTAYKFKCHVLYTSAATTNGIVVALTTTGGGAGTLAANVSANTSASAFSCFALTALNTAITFSATPAINTPYICEIEGIFVCTTSGTLIPQFRSEVTATTTEVLVNAFTEVKTI